MPTIGVCSVGKDLQLFSKTCLKHPHGFQDDEGAIKQTEQGIWDPFSVEDLLQKGVASQLEALQTISVNASKEYGLEKALDKMHADWDGLEFKIIEYKDTGTYIVGGTDDIQVRMPPADVSQPACLKSLLCLAGKRQPMRQLQS